MMCCVPRLGRNDGRHGRLLRDDGDDADWRLCAGCLSLLVPISTENDHLLYVLTAFDVSFVNWIIEGSKPDNKNDSILEH